MMNPAEEIQQMFDAQPGICELCQADCERERQLCDDCDEILVLEQAAANRHKRQRIAERIWKTRRI